MSPCSIECEGLIVQSLDNQVRDDSPIVGVHARTVGVENTAYFDRNAVHPVVIKKERFSAPFSFVVTRAVADRVDVAPIILSLGMDVRISVDFTGRGLENFTFEPFGKPQEIEGAENACLRRLNGI